MSKVVLDADGLIKLQKAGLLKLFSKTYKCLIPEAVYHEAVTKGKEKLYENTGKFTGACGNWIQTQTCG